MNTENLQETRTSSDPLEAPGLGESRAPSQITLRAIVIGALMSMFVGAAVPYTNMIINGTLLAHNFSTPAALFLFFVFTGAINVLLGLLRPGFALARGELAVVYIMAMLATSIPTIGFTENLLPIIAGLYYYATPENNWETLIHPHVPEWIAPHDPLAVKYFFEGLPEGMSLPWDAWFYPLLYWCSFIVSLFWVSICGMVILRRQWIEHEKLIYPLVQVPLEMIRDDEKKSLIKPFFRNPVMWIGFLVPFLLHNLTALHNYYEFIPTIQMSSDANLFRGTTYLRFDLNVALIGFAYLLNRDVALGFWVFFVLSTLERGVFSMLGVQSTENLSRFANSVGPYIAHQTMGAMIVLVLSGLWMARRHLREVWRKAFRRDPAVDDGDEIMSYRAAVWGLLIGLVALAVGLWKSGFPLWVVPVFLFGMLVIFLSITRAVAEAGISVIRTPLTPADFVISGLGTPALGASGLIGVSFTYVWAANIRIFFLPCFANALKLVEEIKANRRALVGAMALAVFVTMAGSIWALMLIAYRYGGVNLHGFFFLSVPRNAFTYIAPMLADPVPASLDGWLFTGVGALAMGLLTLARHRFVWWPVHPLGFATGTFFIMNYVWFSIFLAWFFKSIILKYGGASLYHKTRPFFLGLILGQISVAGLWIAIDFFTGMTGNQPIGKSQL